MFGRSVRIDHCSVCGRGYPLEQHHVVRRSAGNLFVNGKKLEKPTLTLCGFGNNLTDADGRFYCHGLAHAGMLHFRVVDGEWEYIRTEEPVKYSRALQMEGWKPLNSGEWL